MKLRAIFRFELRYQLRRLSTWLSFVALSVVAFLFVRQNFLSDALYDDFYLNSPFIIASATVFGSLLWFLTAAPVAGELGARDVETGMHPLAYTSPVTRAEYLGGRFLAALALNLGIMLAIPLGVLIGVYGPGVDPQVVGPFRPVAYLTAYGFIALPNAFVGTSIQFAFATLGRRAIGSYIGSVVLFFLAYGGFVFVSFFVGRPELAALLDLFGHIFITSDLVLGWTPIERNTRLIELEGTLLRSRFLWCSIAVGALAFTYARFRFEHHTPRPLLSRLTRRVEAHAPTPGGAELARGTVSVPEVRQSFGLATRLRQTAAIAGDSFRTIARSRGGLPLLAGIAALVVVVLPQNFNNLGTPLLPRTGYLLGFLTSALTDPITPWVIVPLLLVFHAGELVWREREAGLGEISDAAPVPEWVLLLGRFLGLGLVLAAWLAFLAVAGVAIQARLGYRDFEIGLYLRVLYGLQLPEYLLFALLALVVQGVIRQKYLGHLAALLAYACILFAFTLGIDHDLLVYGAGPGWAYSDMRGFGLTLGPWLWFKLYWAAWALLVAVLGTTLWVRGMEGSPRARLRLARARLTRPTALAGAVALALIFPLGGFIFYNTNVLNAHETEADGLARQAEYERRYRRYALAPRPRLAVTRLHVEIYPERREARIRGSYRLVNDGDAPIDTIHLATLPGVETGAVTFDRPAAPRVLDRELGHHIYALATPLRPGESLRLGFEVRYRSRGFGMGGVASPVLPNGSWFTSVDWLPAIGYQATRELIRPADRREYGLAARPLLPSVAEVDGEADVTGEEGRDFNGADRIAVETVIGTAVDQVAIAPGMLRRSWTEGGRRYFHYATERPIGTEYGFFSARYAVRREEWRDPSGRKVSIEAYHHPEHAANLDRMLRSVRASMDHNSREFGPYRYDHLRLIENPARGMGAHADAATIDYGQGWSLYDPAHDPDGLDFPFAVMAHEMGHQFGVPYAFAEGAGLLTESFAWYAAMGVVEETYGREHLQRLRRFFRQPTPIPPIRQSVPLLRAMDPYAAYRKGPAALWALGEYIGQERVNLAFRRLRERPVAGPASLPTSLDLYRELEAVTPDSVRPLLHDLFAANTFWELSTERATAKRTAAGSWEVTLEVRARKVTVDPAGVETERPLDQWVEVGVFGRTGESAEFGETLYLRRHRVRAGEQTIRVTVPREPADAGIDPYVVFVDLERFDNVEEVDIDG